MTLKTLARRIRPRTWILSGLLVLAIAGGATYWLGFALPAANASSEDVAATTTTATASLETLEQTVAATGTLTPTVQQDVDFEVAGTVTAVNVVVGQTVAAGDVLATVDTLQVDAALLQAKATLAKAQATLADSEDAADGTDSSDAQIASDTAAVTVAQAAVDAATANVGKATLTAPVAGLITAVDVSVGDAISSSGSSSSGSTESTGSTGSVGTTGAAGSTSTSTTSTTASTTAFTLVGTDAWQVDLTVGESDLANVAVNDQVELSLDDGTAFFGTVSEVGLLPSTTSGAAAYPVAVSVTGDPDGMFDGIAVTAAIVYERRTDVLTVPTAAVTTADGVSTVTVRDADGTDTQATVTVGETVGDLTEITDGLAEGDSVVMTVFNPAGGENTQSGTGEMGQFPGGGTGEFPGGTGGTGTFPGGGQAPQAPGGTGSN